MSLEFSEIIKSSAGYPFIAKIIVIFLSLPFHECAHAWTAAKLGDFTGANEGRITLNPFAHLDLWGTIMILVFGMGYAKPVPVNTNNFRRPKRDSAIVSLIGPLSNILMAIAFLSVGYIIGIFVTEIKCEFYCYALSCSLRYAAYINFQLALFNLIPVPPLDGYHVLLGMVSNRIYYKLKRFERVSVYTLFGPLLAFRILHISPVTYTAQILFCMTDGICRILSHNGGL